MPFLHRPYASRHPRADDTAWDFSGGFARIILNGKYGYIDKTGKEICPIKYDYAYGFSGGLAQVELNGKCGVINSQGKEIIPLIFDGIEFLSSAIRVVLNYQFGVINYSGEYILPCKYDRICLCNDIIIATKTNKELIFDEKGELIAEKH